MKRIVGNLALVSGAGGYGFQGEWAFPLPKALQDRGFDSFIKTDPTGRPICPPDMIMQPFPYDNVDSNGQSMQGRLGCKFPFDWEKPAPKDHMSEAEPVYENRDYASSLEQEDMGSTTLAYQDTGYSEDSNVG